MTVMQILTTMLGDTLIVAEIVLGRAAALIVALAWLGSTLVLLLGRGRRL